MAEETVDKKEPTEAELKEYRENMKKFYEGEIPLLKKKREYEILLADIEEARAKSLTMRIRQAQLLNPPGLEEESEEDLREQRGNQEEGPKEEKKNRKLKKED